MENMSQSNQSQIGVLPKMAGFIAYFNTWDPVMRKFENKDIGKLLRATLVYAETGVEPDFYGDDSNMDFVWEFSIKRDIDAERRKFERNYERKMQDREAREARERRRQEANGAGTEERNRNV